MTSSEIGNVPIKKNVVGKGGDGGARNPTPPHPLWGVGGGGVPEVGVQSGGETARFDGLTLGIDLGTQGADALVDRAGDLIAVEDLPVLPDGPRARPHINAAVLADLLRSWQPSCAYVEFVGARPTDSRVGAFSFGMARGSVEAVLATLAIPVSTITAPAWKRIIGIAPGTGQKSTARAEATRRVAAPRCALREGLRRRQSRGRADRDCRHDTGGTGPMNRAEKIAFNAGVAALAQIAAASADALQDRITAAPTRYNFAVGALRSIVEAAGDLMLQLPPGGTEPSTVPTPQPLAPTSGEPAHISEEEITHG